MWPVVARARSRASLNAVSEDHLPERPAIVPRLADAITYALVAGLFGALVELLLDASLDRLGQPRLLASVGTWVLLAWLLRARMCRRSKRSTIRSAVGWAVAWTALRVPLDVIEVIRFASAIRSPTPMDIAIDVRAYLMTLGVALVVALPVAVLGAFALRALPRFRRRTET